MTIQTAPVVTTPVVAAPQSFVKALNAHLRLPGESMASFALQVKSLGPQDRQDLAKMFEMAGIPIIADTINKVAQ